MALQSIPIIRLQKKEMEKLKMGGKIKREVVNVRLQRSYKHQGGKDDFPLLTFSYAQTKYGDGPAEMVDEIEEMALALISSTTKKQRRKPLL